MNFKETYKSCNDEIYGNREVLASVLTGKTKSKKNFEYRYIAVFAMLCLVVTATFFYKNSNDKIIDKASVYIASDDRSHTPEETPGISEPEEVIERDDKSDNADFETDGQPSQNNNGIKAPSGVYYENQTQRAKKNEKNSSGERKEKTSGKASLIPEEKTASADVSDNSDVSTQTAGGNIKSEDNGDKAVIYDETNAAIVPERAENDSIAVANDAETFTPAEPSSKIMAKGSGGDSEAPEKPQMTADEYFDYIGVDVIEKAELPEDMKFDTNPRVIYESDNGSVVHDSFNISASSETDSSRHIDITMSKTSEFTPDTGNDNSTVDGINGVSVRIDSQNVSQEEVDTLLDSLKK